MPAAPATSHFQASMIQKKESGPAHFQGYTLSYWAFGVLVKIKSFHSLRCLFSGPLNFGNHHLTGETQRNLKSSISIYDDCEGL